MVDDTVDRAQDHRQGLIHKDEDHGDLWKVLGVRQLLTPVRMELRLLACTNQGCLKNDGLNFNDTRR